MDWTLEVVVVPVTDVDAAIAFYRDQVGFHLDHDTHAGDQRFAQLTPPGSGCSIVLSDPPPMPPGSLKGVQLVVADAYRAHTELCARGVPAGDINVIDERDGGTLFEFADPDGNGWVVQQIAARDHAPLIPRARAT
jgi:catechol 2,3-dioxygenase-like lactoylglutathione lyase family enzyme